MLAALLNTPSTDNEWQIWSWHHRLSTSAINSAISQQKKINLTDYQLDPINRAFFQDWLERNQQSHIDFDAAVGAQSVDLTDVDPSNHNQFQAWIFSHYLEHQTAERILGIGS
jgi:hypothetical protein